MKTANIIIATHKKYEMPKEKIYIPLHVGAFSGKELGYKKDNTGDNISEKNPYFCELTGLYWAWKNLKCDYYGLVHYRRHFTLKSGRIKKDKRIESVLSEKQLDKLIKQYDLIVPKKRNYVIETLYSHYEHTLHIEPLNLTRNIILKHSPKYLAEFDKIKTRRSGHMFNMMIGKKEIIDKYCEWLFEILFALEKEIKKEKIDKKYDKFHARFYGRISELLFDVWLYTNYPETSKNLENDSIKVKELRVIDIEKTNWVKKGGSFLLAKFTGRKYGKSF